MENMQALQGLKQVIKVKTECLNEMISIKGKIEMLKTTFQMQDPCQKYQKIKNNLKKLNENGEGDVITYQDQSDDDKEFDEAMEDN